MGVLRHRLLVMALMAIAASRGRRVWRRRQVGRATAGARGHARVRRRQRQGDPGARREPDRRVHDGPRASSTQPVDPFARSRRVTGKARISDEEFTKQFGYGISTLFGKGNQQSDPNERIRNSLSAADRAAYDRALGGDNPGVTFAEAVDSGDFSELGGCTKEASDASFGGAAVLNVAGRAARRARRAHHPGPADGAGQREVVRVHAGEGLPLRGARRDRRGPRRSASRRSSAPACRPGHLHGPAGRELRPGRAHRAPARRRSGSRTPTSSARSRRSSRSSARCGRSTRSSSARRTSSCSRGCSPANQ